ncbi:hypothetical protein EW146_g5848 [Bondarzewia mesenterica]|uniref:Uncharacterized protein n=1 Tax=Bondarzewia mesenterica TaxID=1095465 RepID=A0A4S4LVZ1_9AGAM|nr:hypothetical protein EW146_g5848 [Bondarzewia mesenterica]
MSTPTHSRVPTATSSFVDQIIHDDTASIGITPPKPELEPVADTAHPLSASMLKAQRAHEHGRQRAKKAGDRIKGRMSRAANAKGEREKRVEESKKDVDWDARDEVRVLEDLEQRKVGMGVFASTWGGRESREVKLVDLVRPSKSLRKKCAVDGDFEFIPHVRSVIVLDDHVRDDAELNEPWEYVSSESESEDSTKALSYAEIVSKRD